MTKVENGLTRRNAIEQVATGLGLTSALRLEARLSAQAGAPPVMAPRGDPSFPEPRVGKRN